MKVADVQQNLCVILLLLKESHSKTIHRNDKHEIDTVSYATRR